MHRFFLKGREERKNVGTRMVTRKNRQRKNFEKNVWIIFISAKMINAE